VQNVAMPVEVKLLGTGNSFAAGGRSNACILVTAEEGRVLLDCGASALPMITRTCDTRSIDAIAISHLHGDHVGGIPYLALEQKWAGRTRPLVIAGPPSLERWFDAVGPWLVDNLYDGPLPYELDFRPWTDKPMRVGPAEVTAFPVVHVPASDPYGFRVRIGGKVIAYSGDTTWCDQLIEIADGADLFICEATPFEGKNPVHLSAKELAAHLPELRCKRLVATHLDHTSLAHLSELEFEYAVDGMTIEL
jgi:ribonuclease BN (tRNA processing enzyme)